MPDRPLSRSAQSNASASSTSNSPTGRMPATGPPVNGDEMALEPWQPQPASMHRLGEEGSAPGLPSGTSQLLEESVASLRVLRAEFGNIRPRAIYIGCKATGHATQRNGDRFGPGIRLPPATPDAPVPYYMANRAINGADMINGNRFTYYEGEQPEIQAGPPPCYLACQVEHDDTGTGDGRRGELTNGDDYELVPRPSGSAGSQGSSM